MNEVRPTQLTIPLVARTASSQGADVAKSLPQSGKELPVKEAEPNTVKADKLSLTLTAEPSPAVDIEQAVTEINEYVQSIQRDLHFSVDEESGLTVVRVRDKESGELIRQIPEDVFLNLARAATNCAREGIEIRTLPHAPIDGISCHKACTIGAL